jgi:hypothetical protein
VKKKSLVIFSALVFSSGIANALQFSQVSCNGNSGKINISVHASPWDAVFHEHIIVKGYSFTSHQWKTVIKPLNHGQHKLSVDMMEEADLMDVDSFKILTKKATIVVGRCN